MTKINQITDPDYQIGHLKSFGYDEDGPRRTINLKGTTLHPSYSNLFTIVNISDESVLRYSDQ